MKYYGLHWKASDNVPLQVRVDTNVDPDLQVWARWAPSGGSWTAWRRLDVVRNEDGTLNETVQEAIHAASADTATSLSTTCSVTFEGDVTGSFDFNGTDDITCNLKLSSTAGGGSGSSASGNMMRTSTIRPMVGGTSNNSTYRPSTDGYAPSESGTWACFYVYIARSITQHYDSADEVTDTYKTGFEILASGAKANITDSYSSSGTNSHYFIGGVAFKVG
ncbi:MAG: hypothetical protein J5861_04810 [Desulfovibrio sp.]|nr:hypothetical protein [Desulfovibrio sp.]